jgi:hypothetical protein
MTHPAPENTQGSQNPDGAEAHGKDTSARASHGPLTRGHKKNKQRQKTHKVVTPGFKAVLIPETQFNNLKALQATLPHPRRLSVGDLAGACIDLGMRTNDGDAIVKHSTQRLRESL